MRWAVLSLGICGSAAAQSTVTIDLSKSINTLTQQSVGVVPQMGDAELFTGKNLATLKSAGITSIMYPAGWASTSQLYHWSTNSTMKNAGAAPESQNVFTLPANNMGALVEAVKAGVAPIIVVNYGSNLKGQGPGEPKEAAAWVAYVNGDPSDAKVIGEDSSGNDWKTVGFWASLRASAPLAADDGYNFLRVQQAKPLEIRLWQIGESEDENGYYGGDHKGTADFHAPYPASSKDSDHRAKDSHLSPAFYGQRLLEFAAAMKNVDSKIWIGATLATPTIDKWADGWNEGVLKESCKAIDFVSFGWHPGALRPPDWKSLDEPSVVNAVQREYPNILKEAIYQDHQNCPAGKVPHIVLSQVAPPLWLKPDNPVVNALFAADVFATTTESGLIAEWAQLRPQGLMQTNYDPQPAFFGLQMLHIVAFRPGDTYVAVSGAPESLAVHATHRQDGLVGVMLVNKDPSAPQTVKLQLKYVHLAEKGVRFEYGPAQVKANQGLARSDLAGVADKMTVVVPPYSIVDLLLPIAK